MERVFGDHRLAICHKCLDPRATHGIAPTDAGDAWHRPYADQDAGKRPKQAIGDPKKCKRDLKKVKRDLKKVKKVEKARGVGTQTEIQAGAILFSQDNTCLFPHAAFMKL